jgi:serralysin
MLKAAREDIMSTVFRVVLTGDQEVTLPPLPPGGTGSDASGVGTVIFDSAEVAASYSFDIQGLDFGPVTGRPPQTPNDSGDNVTRTHFHTAPANANGPIVFGQIDTVVPANEQDDDDFEIELNADGSWSLSGVWETTDPVNNQSIADFADVLGSATVGMAVPLYFNVHTSEFGAGEIRGQLVAIADDIDDVVTGTVPTATATGNDILDGGNGNDAILSLAGEDILGGANGDDVLDGGGGNDTLTGGNGNDMLFGSVGNDTMMGGKGEDTLDGGAGDDLMVGGKGPDLFAFNAGFAGFGHDIINDFSNGDHIQFDSGLFADAQAVLDASEQDGADTVITLDADNDIRLVGVTSLQADDILIVA